MRKGLLYRLEFVGPLRRLRRGRKLEEEHQHFHIRSRAALLEQALLSGRESQEISRPDTDDLGAMAGKNIGTPSWFSVGVSLFNKPMRHANNKVKVLFGNDNSN